MSRCNFHSLEVVGRGGETQPQVGESLEHLAGKMLKYVASGA